MATHPLVNIAIKASQRAGNLIANAATRLSSVMVSEKKPNDYVTDIDIRAEEMIIETIRKVHPTHAILAEESGANGENDTVWIIDPLDGTRNFVHGLPHFAVSIAVQYKNRIEHAVIYDPIRQELFTASRGQGAQLNSRRIRVSSRDRIENTLLSTGFPFKKRDAFDKYVKGYQTLFEEGATVRRSGSAALDLAYVAAGRLDGHWEYHTQPWDIAAGLLLVKEAGGLCSDAYGGEQQLINGSVVAGNPKIFKHLLQTIGQVR
jgi:myo-inositol-1(or 4)-monophosphatase